VDWNNRSDRIHRLKEKENFRAVIMPLAYAGFAVALAGLFWEGVVKMDGGKCDDTILVPAAFFFVLPLFITVFRCLRGHFSKRLMA